MHGCGMQSDECAGTRTQDLRIKSPLLYQLSYALAVLALRRVTHYRHFRARAQLSETGSVCRHRSRAWSHENNSSDSSPGAPTFQSVDPLEPSLAFHLVTRQTYNLPMSLVHDRCICLRKVEYSETSQILLLFSRDYGLQRVVAKGAHRRTKAGSSKFDGGVDLLDVGQAVFTQRLERDLGLLTEWSLREGHLDLRNNLRGMYLALYAAELVSLLFEEHDPHPDMFDRLEATLAELGTPRTEEAFLAFELDLLRESGYLPEMGT